MTFKEIIRKVAQEIDIPEEVVKLAYRSDWDFRRKTIEQLPLKEDLSEEEFKALRVNFNLPALGKLHLTYEHYLLVKERFKILKELRERKK